MLLSLGLFMGRGKERFGWVWFSFWGILLGLVLVLIDLVLVLEG